MAPSAAHSKLFARAGLLLIGLAWTLPFLQPFHRYPLPSFYSEWLALVLGLMGLVPLLRRGSWDGLPIPWVSLGAMCMIALVWLQFSLGMMTYVGQALVPSVYLLWAALLMLAGSLLRRELGWEVVTTGFSWFLLVGGILSAAAGIVQHYQFAPLVGTVVTVKKTAQVFGNLAQANHFAAYSALSLVSLGYLASRSKLARFPAMVAGLLLLFAAAISGSRSIWLYLTVMLVFALGLYMRDHRPEHRLLLIYSAVALPAFVVANGIAGLPSLAPSASEISTSLDRLFTTASGLDMRYALWREAWWMFESAPLLGVGAGQFAWHHFIYQTLFGPLSDIGLANHAHNIVLQLLAEAGLFGALLVGGVAATWLVGLAKCRTNSELWWLLAILAVITVHSGVEFPLWYTFFLGIASVTAGIGATQEVRLNLPRIGAPMILGVLVIGLVHSALVLRDFRRMEQLIFTPYHALSEIPAREEFVETLPELHREPLLEPYVELTLAYGIAVSGEMLQEKLDLNNRAMHFAPVPVLVYSQALLLALAGKREEARAQLERSLRVYPREHDEIVSELEKLARRRPGEFAPLLELATAKSAAPRAPTVTR